MENKKVSRELCLKGGLRQPQLQKAEAVSEAGKRVCMGLSGTMVQMGGCSPTSGTCCRGVGWRDLSQKLV